MCRLIEAKPNFLNGIVAVPSKRIVQYSEAIHYLLRDSFLSFGFVEGGIDDVEHGHEYEWNQSVCSCLYFFKTLPYPHIIDALQRSASDRTITAGCVIP